SLAASPKTTSSASSRRWESGSLRFAAPLATLKRPEICCCFFLNRPCMFRRINNCPLCSRSRNDEKRLGPGGGKRHLQRRGLGNRLLFHQRCWQRRSQAAPGEWRCHSHS